jgi:hypothetical protein
MTEHEQVSGLSIYIVVKVMVSCVWLVIVKRKKGEPTRIPRVMARPPQCSKSSQALPTVKCKSSILTCF